LIRLGEFVLSIAIRKSQAIETAPTHGSAPSLGELGLMNNEVGN
jgi:hypothetical protein